MMIILLGAVTSLLLQRITAQAIVYPYNCKSTVPVCQLECVTAVNHICLGNVGKLTTELNNTVGGCTAKYIPHNNVADSHATCVANFQKILLISDGAASTCDGKTPTRIGGVLALDTDNKLVSGTSYAIFPAVNSNPNCVVNPTRIDAPVVAKNNLLGTTYSCPDTIATAVINSRSVSADCYIAVALSSLCSSGCALGILMLA